MQGPVTKLA